MGGFIFVSGEKVPKILLFTSLHLYLFEYERSCSEKRNFLKNLLTLSMII